MTGNGRRAAPDGRPGERGDGEAGERRPAGTDERREGSSLPTVSRRRVLQAVGASGAVTVAGCLGGGGGGDPCRDLRIDLSTGTTNFTPDTFGTTDTDWEVTRPNGTTTQATSVQPVSSWVTLSSANWIDSEGTGGWPAPSDPIGNYVYETDFEVPDTWEEGQCELRIYDWSVDDAATLELDGPGGTTTLDQATAPGHTSLNGPVTQPVTAGQYTLRARVRNDQTVSGLLVHAEVFCDCDAGGSDPGAECDLSVTKEHSGESVSYGDTTDFEVTVCNDGDGECEPEPVTVTDQLPTGTTLAGHSGNGWSCTESGGVVTCEHPNSGGLAPGACLPTLTLELAVGGPDEVGDLLVNCAELAFEGADEPLDRDCIEVPVTPPPGECDLSITKTHDGEPVAPGATTQFQVEVCNEGDGLCRGLVSVVDELPPGLTFVSASGSGWTCVDNGGVVTCEHPNAGGLAPGACLPALTLTVELGSADEVGDAVRNCARLEYEDANATNHSDCALVPVDTGGGGECDLSVRKRHRGETVAPGDATAFEVVVCNVGDGLCEDPVTVLDDLPPGVSFDAASGTNWSVTDNGGTLVCTHPNAGGLAPGACLPTLVLEVTVGSLDETGDQIRNCARLEGEDANPENDLGCASVPVEQKEGQCDLSVEKTHPAGDVVEAGSTTTFEVEVCNVGDGRCADPVTVVDDLPPGVSFVSAAGSGWSATDSGGTLTCEHPNGGGLPPGACLPTLTLTVQVGSTGETGDAIRNCVALRGTDVNARNDRDCVTVGVTEPSGGCEALEIEKTTGGQFTYGQQETYEITVCNPSNAPCDGRVVVTDDLPGGITFVSVGGSGWSGSASGGVLTATHANAGGLAPGNCLPTLTVTVDVAPANQFPGGSDAVVNCAELVAGGTVVDEDCVQHVIFNV